MPEHLVGSVLSSCPQSAPRPNAGHRGPRHATRGLGPLKWCVLGGCCPLGPLHKFPLPVATHAAPFSTSQQSPWYPPLIVFRKDLLLTPSLLPHLPSPNLHFFGSSCSCAKSNSNSSRRWCKSNRFSFPHCWLGFWLFLNVLFSFIHLFSCFLHVFIVVSVSFQWGGKD